jgi:hypothetical protein
MPTTRSNVSKKESNDEQDSGGQNEPTTPKMKQQQSSKISNPQTTHRQGLYNFQGIMWPLQETHMTLPFLTKIKGKNKIIKI